VTDDLRMPRHVIIGTAGHIDHGKSALVLALTGTDPDRLKEEKARGITIDLGFAHWASGEFVFSFVDVPGHERFVKNMLAGVGGIDAVVLVVAADESVMPQTREHFEICRLLGVRHGVVAITKSDLADADTVELVRMEVRELAAGSFLDGAPMVAVSSRTGEGLDTFRQTLVELARRVRPRPDQGAVRLPIDRVFSVKGFGTVVTGTLLSGSVRADDELVQMPGARRMKVRGVQVHGQSASVARAGQRAALNLGGIDLSEIRRGDALLTPETLEPTRMIDARIEVVSSVRALRHGARVRFHQGTSEVLGRVALASVLPGGQEEGSLPAGTSPAAGISGGRSAYVRLRFEGPAVLARGDRFILRAYSPPTTIAGGSVLDPHPARGAIRTPSSLARLASLDAPDLSAQEAVRRAVTTMVGERGAGGLPVAALVSRAGVDPAEVEVLLGDLARSGAVARVGQTLVPPPVLDALGRRVLQRLGDHHRSEPLSEGMPREELREREFARAGEGVFEHVLAGLQHSRRIAGRERVALASHRVSLSPDEEKARAACETAFRDAGLRPPDPKEVAAAHGVPPEVMVRIVQLLVRQKILVRLEAVYFHQSAIDRLKQDMRALKADAVDGGARIDVGTFKTRYDVSRKYAIPLLEYLDRERVTRRVGEGRVLI
jgi:selenocysteine-specific elongation factor